MILFERRTYNVALWLNADERDLEDDPGSREMGAPFNPPEPDAVVPFEDVHEFVVAWLGAGVARGETKHTR